MKVTLGNIIFCVRRLVSYFVRQTHKYNMPISSQFRIAMVLCWIVGGADLSITCLNLSWERLFELELIDCDILKNRKNATTL